MPHSASSPYPDENKCVCISTMGVVSATSRTTAASSFAVSGLVSAAACPAAMAMGGRPLGGLRRRALGSPVGGGARSMAAGGPSSSTRMGFSASAQIW